MADTQTTKLKQTTTYGQFAQDQGVTRKVTGVNDKGLDVGINYDTISYPPSLGDDVYPHFMMFFINANAASSFQYTGTKINQQENLTNALDTRANSKFQFTSGIEQATGVGDGTKTVENESVTKSIQTNPVIKAIAGATGNAIISQPNKRMTLAMCLPMPNNLNQAFGAGYDIAEVGLMGSAISDLVSGQMSFEGGVKVAAQTAITAAASIIAKTTKSDPKSSKMIAEKMAGRVTNTRQEQVFQKMQLREFTFTWDLVPRNQTEHDAILNIIKAFKANMHPELPDSGAALLLMPSEFDIQFRYKNEENASIGKIATCALTQMAVNYTSGGKFVAVSGTDKPLCISLALTFKEMEPIVRNMIEQKDF